MISLVILGIALLLSCFWLWDSWRRAKAEQFTIRPLTPEERKEAEKLVNETDDFML